MPNPGVDLPESLLLTGLPFVAQFLEQFGLTGSRNLCQMRSNEGFDIRITHRGPEWRETSRTPIFAQVVDRQVLAIDRLQ
jgi:hypothetical protein